MTPLEDEWCATPWGAIHGALDRAKKTGKKQRVTTKVILKYRFWVIQEI